MRHAKNIESYLTTVGNAYDSNLEMSFLMLNVFKLWVSMDNCAAKAIHLLRDDHPMLI